MIEIVIISASFVWAGFCLFSSNFNHLDNLEERES